MLFCIFRPHTEFSNESYYNYDDTVTPDVSSESVDSNETSKEDSIDESKDSNGNHFHESKEGPRKKRNSHSINQPLNHEKFHGFKDIGRRRKGLRQALHRLILFKQSVSCLILTIGCLTADQNKPKSQDRLRTKTKPVTNSGKVLDSGEDHYSSSDQDDVSEEVGEVFAQGENESLDGEDGGAAAERGKQESLETRNRIPDTLPDTRPVPSLSAEVFN